MQSQQLFITSVQGPPKRKPNERTHLSKRSPSTGLKMGLVLMGVTLVGIGALKLALADRRRFAADNCLPSVLRRDVRLASLLGQQGRDSVSSRRPTARNLTPREFNRPAIPNFRPQNQGDAT